MNREDSESSNCQEYISTSKIEVLLSNVDKTFVTKFSKEFIVEEKAKWNTRIMKFTSDYNIDEIISELENLHQKDYANLFILIVETKTKNRIEEIKNVLNKFGELLIFIVHLIPENNIILYYREDNSCEFVSGDQQQDRKNYFYEFSTFFWSFLNEKIKSLEEEIIEKIQNFQISSLILRFIRVLKLPDHFLNDIILNCASCGSKSNLLAALDVPLKDNDKLLDIKVQKYLTNVFDEDQPSIEVENDQNDQDLNDLSIVSSSDSLQDSVSEKSNVIHHCSSVLYAAIENSNKEVVDYLISQCSFLIQQLPFNHQVQISTIAFKSNPDILCDLLEFSDFPFPDQINQCSMDNPKLCKIAESRSKFSVDIMSENYSEILKFIENNMHLKFVYNLSNITAMKQAIELKKYNVYFYLKSFGFKAIEFTSLDEILSGDELEMANQQAKQQRKANVYKALSDTFNAVMLLSTRSFIHNRKIGKKQETEYHAKIKQWYESIEKIKYGSELLNVAASCENLKIIFDFDNNSVNYTYDNNHFRNNHFFFLFLFCFLI